MVRSWISWLCILTIVTVTGEDVCWSTFGDYQYKVLTPSGGVLFADAVEQCISINTTLASIHSAEEEEFLELFVMNQLGVPLWIGLRRNANEIYWVDGTELDYLSPKYTRKNTREGCVYVFMGWNEESCEAAQLHFICKREVTDADACPTTTVFVPSPSHPESTSFQSSTTAPDSTITNVPTTDVTGKADGITSSQNDVTESDTLSTSQDDTEITSETVKGTTHMPSVSVSSDQSASSIKSDSTVPKRTTPVSVTTSPIKVSSTERKLTFQEMLDEMTVKKKPVYEIREGANSTAIGSVSVLILVGIMLGIVLLDLSTIKRHIRMIKNNTKDVCRRNKKTEVIYFK